MTDHATISSLHAFFLAGVISSSYVLSVYISRLIAEPRPPLWRNDPAVIKARSLLASASTALSCGLVYLTVKANVNGDGTTTLEYLGIPHKSFALIPEAWKAYFIVPALFLGPLYSTFLDGALPFQRNWDFKTDLVSRFTTWEGIRNYLMAPITEEVTYRACVLSVYRLAAYTRKTMIWVAPCWFGLAHIHHGFETYKRMGKTSSALRTALMSTIFQFIYTTVFGWLCSFLFLRTGSIIVPTIAHIFCNVMGFPAITWELKQFPSHRICDYPRV
ncbi:Abi-domain-containing protein, partial [Fomitiporia mediterranea MF3/22]|uniref:Abi-domain-containing protein n=1 Tax=Fomitiporia mediterranea (strain MF3/22) TaxID=694068 RepID=UPI0004407D82